MYQKLNIDAIEKQLKFQITEKVGNLMFQWQEQARQFVPLGYSNSLKSTLRVEKEIKPNAITYKMTSLVLYALEQSLLKFTHVPVNEVGKVGWQKYGHLVNKKAKSVIDKYWAGLDWARAHDFPHYLWNYPLKAWLAIGGNASLNNALK